MRDVMRRRHYSIHAERSYCDWVKRHVRFHGMQSREELFDGEKKIEAFLTHLARDRNVAASTQDQDLSALDAVLSRGPITGFRRPAEVA